MTGTARTRAGRAVLFAAALPVTIALLTGCSGGSPVTVPGTAGPAGVSSSTGGSASGSASSPTKSSGGTASTKPASGSSSKGCPAGGTAIPSGAGTARTADLDGDGRADTVWLKDIGAKRTLGVRTASGAGFTRVFESSAPQQAVAYANRLGDGSAVILLDTGRAVPLFAVIGCRIVPTTNAQGQQYSFDLGFTEYGTGVGCPILGGERRLVGYNAVEGTGGTSKVTRTTIILSGGGTKATNGSKVTLGTKLADDSATVNIAHGAACGAAKPAPEPAP